MPALIVVNDPEDWPLHVPDVQVESAHAYLTDPKYSDEPRLKVFNLCRSYRYQRSGYYVSLLAEARGHKPLPSIGTIQDLKSPAIIRVASAELDDLIQNSLAPIHSPEFELSAYFGRNVAKRHEKLASALFRAFQAPFLRAEFAMSPRTKRWSMTTVSPISASEIPEDHRPFAVEVAREFFSGRHAAPRRRNTARYDLAILWDKEEDQSASDERAIKKFVRAGTSIGFNVEIIGKEDYGRLPQFDALFIRDTTSVNHHTFRFSRRAVAEGLIVIDDPDSILKCLNKVFLAELMANHKVPAPKTVIVHKRNVDIIERELGLPCVLKQPDSAFSLGVVKVDTRADLQREVTRLLDRSSLVVAQEFRPTEFDWRIGLIDGQPLYACRYYMARRHWQIIKHDAQNGTKDEGRFETLPVELAPTHVVKTAVKAAGLIGDGLYGVDLKEDAKGVCVIEVNDNPSIDGGIEDQVLKDELYLRIMRVFMNRIEQRKRRGSFT